MEESSILTEFDVGNLSVTKIKNLIPVKNQDEAWITSMTLEAVKGIFNEIIKLPKQYNGDVCLVKLPPSTTVLPREKPIPKPKPPTRWEAFAKKKGITNKRKDKKAWDDNSKSWKPTYGYKSVKNEQDDWLVEIPNNADSSLNLKEASHAHPNQNPFEKKEQKRESIAKNEYQRLRNIAVASKVKVTNMESLDKADKTQLTKSLSAAKVATASMGRFTKTLPKEKTIVSRKRKFQENIPSNIKTEKENYLKILENMNKGKPKLEIKEAVQMHIQKKPMKSEKPDGQQKKKKKGNRSGKNNSFNRGKNNSFNRGKNNSFNRGKKGNKNEFKKK